MTAVKVCCACYDKARNGTKPKCPASFESDDNGGSISFQYVRDDVECVNCKQGDGLRFARWKMEIQRRRQQSKAAIPTERLAVSVQRVKLSASPTLGTGDIGLRPFKTSPPACSPAAGDPGVQRRAVSPPPPASPVRPVGNGWRSHRDTSKMTQSEYYAYVDAVIPTPSPLPPAMSDEEMAYYDAMF